MADHGDSETERLLKALGHPMRRAILRVMPEDGRVSPSEMASALDEPLSNLSYHFRSLDRSPLVELVEETQVRGATQHFYERTLKHDWVRELLEEPEDWGS